MNKDKEFEIEQDEIRKQIIDLFQKREVDDLMRVLHFLDEQEKIYKDDPKPPPVWRTLIQARRNKNAFLKYLDHIIADTKTLEKNVGFQEVMNLMYSEWIDASEESPPENADQGYDPELLLRKETEQKSFFVQLVRTWDYIPNTFKGKLVNYIVKVGTSRTALTGLDDVIGSVSNYGGTLVMVGLAAVWLSTDVIKNLWRWWNGEISGKRCCKNIIDTMVSIGAGIGGGFAGAVCFGSFFGPVGTILGGIVGGCLSANAAMVFSDKLTQCFFDLPKYEALENAYLFFGISRHATNNEINSAFRRSCLLHHPDKGGSNEEFYKVQISMAIIKLSKENKHTYGESQNFEKRKELYLKYDH